jgi:hypothetical protein
VSGYDDTNHTGLLGFVRVKDGSGTVIRDWTFPASDEKPDSGGRVSVVGICSERIIASELPATLRIAVQVTGTGRVCDIKSNASGFNYSNLIIKKVASA